MVKKPFLLLIFLQLSLNGCFGSNIASESVSASVTGETGLNDENIIQGVRTDNLTELANPSGSYEFTGAVKDKETGVPLEKVKISVSSDTGSQEIFTGKDGSFSLLFNRKGKALLVFSLENYGTIAEIIDIEQEKNTKEILLQRVAGFIRIPH